MKINLSGPLEIEGFPVDLPFVFEVQGEAFVLRAGTKLFLVVRREEAPTTEAVKKATREEPRKAKAPAREGISEGLDRELADQKRLGEAQTNPATESQETARAVLIPPTVGSPGIGAHESVQSTPADLVPDKFSIIHLDVSRASKYRTNRRKWFDLLSSLNGRPVGELGPLASIQNLEGAWEKMVSFFIQDGALRLLPEYAAPGEVIATSPNPPVTSPSPDLQNQAATGAFIQGHAGTMFSGPSLLGGDNALAQLAAAQNAAQQAANTPNQGMQLKLPAHSGANIPGPLWSPPGNAGGSTDGPKFP